MKTTRRGLLQGLGAGVGLAALGGLPRPAGAALSGDTTLACGPYKTLQIKVFGAPSHRDALWVDDPANGWAPWRVEPNMALVSAQAAGAQKIAFAQADDHVVYLGAGFSPLLGSPLLTRTRLLAMSAPGPAEHTLRSAHALCGVEFGRPGFAATGARVAARYLGTDPLPPAWVVDAAQSSQITGFATETGQLGGQYRPFVVPVGSNNFKTSLDRSGRDHIDGLLAMYRKRYGDGLVHGSTSVRSQAFDAYDDAVNRLIDWQAVHDVVNTGPSLAASNAELAENRLTAGIHFAGHLLAAGARHVVVLGGAGAHPSVDTHNTVANGYEFHARRANGVIWGAMNAVRQLIDEGTLDADNCLFTLNGEFGRFNQYDADEGTEHLLSYAGVVMGGPVTASGLGGRLDFTPDNNGKAVGGFTPTDVAAAVAMAAGVDPFQLGAIDRYTLSNPGNTDAEAREWLASALLNGSTDPVLSCVDDIQIQP